MSVWSIGYIVILFIAFGVSLWFRAQIVFAARRRPVFLTLYLAAAAVVAGVTIATSHTPDAYVSGLFISGMFLVFAFWQRGLTATSLVNGLGSVRQYTNLSAVQLQALDGGCLVVGMVGANAVVRLQFKQSPQALAAFLQTKMDKARVVIIS